MTRPLSQLLYTRAHDGGDGPPVITLHDANQYGPDVAAWGRAVSPGGRVTALESYKGVFVGHAIVGYTWFLGPLHAPSPIFFGDSLSEIERFLWDEVDRSAESSPESPLLVGIGQGGMMAIATALAVPELVGGVIAIDACLPIVPGWDPPLAPMRQLPMLLVNQTPLDHPRVLAGDALVNQLRAWDIDVSTCEIAQLSPDTLAATEWVSTRRQTLRAPL